MPHPTTLDGLTPKQLAQAIGHFRYDTLKEFLDELAIALNDEVAEGAILGEDELTRVKTLAIGNLSLASNLFEIAWIMVRPNSESSSV